MPNNITKISIEVGSTLGWYKYDFSNGKYLSGVTTYINAVTYGAKFASISGWGISGGDLTSYAGFQYTKSYCAYLCTITTGCVGAVWDNIHCVLKNVFNTPTSNSNEILLLPCGIGNCRIEIHFSYSGLLL